MNPDDEQDAWDEAERDALADEEEYALAEAGEG